MYLDFFQCRIFFFIYGVLLNCDFHDLSPHQGLCVSLTCNPTANATLGVFPLELNFHYVLNYKSTALLIDGSFAIPHILFLWNASYYFLVLAFPSLIIYNSKGVLLAYACEVILVPHPGIPHGTILCYVTLWYTIL